MVNMFLQANYMRALEAAVRAGGTVLLEDVGETLDAALEPLLQKQVKARTILPCADTPINHGRREKDLAHFAAESLSASLLHLCILSTLSTMILHQSTPVKQAGMAPTWVCPSSLI